MRLQPGRRGVHARDEPFAGPWWRRFRVRPPCPPTDTKRSRAVIVRLVLWYDAPRVFLPQSWHPRRLAPAAFGSDVVDQARRWLLIVVVASQLLGPPADQMVP